MYCDKKFEAEVHNVKNANRLKIIHWLGGTVKLGNKELLYKEQTGFIKEFLIITKSFIPSIYCSIWKFCQSKKWQNLSLFSEHVIVKISSKRDQFWDFTLKRVPGICNPCIIWKHFGSKVNKIEKTIIHSSLFPTKKMHVSGILYLI